MIFAAALIAAVAYMFRLDRPEWKLPALFAVLLGVSAVSTGDFVALGVADIVLAMVAVSFGTRRGYVTAGLLAAMGGAYALGQLINIPDHATYGLVELFCVACLGVMVNADKWGSGMRRRFGDLGRAFGHVAGRNLTDYVGSISAPQMQEKAKR